MSGAAEILGGDAVTGEPAAVRAVATHLRTVSTNVDTVRGQLLDRSGDDGWAGAAADAFRTALAEVPDELAKVTSSYDAAATTISSYASTLDHLRSRSDALATQISDAQQRLAVHAATRAGAQRARDLAAHAHASAVDPSAHATTQAVLDRATSTLTNADACVSTTNAEIVGLRRDAHANRLDFEGAVRRCCDGLDAASDLGIRNSLLTWYDRHVAHGAPIGRLFDGLVVAPFREAAGALQAFVADPSWNALSALLGGVGDALAIVGCVLLIAALGFGTGGMAFAVGGLLLAGSRGLVAAKLGTDAVRAGRGEAGAGNDILDDAIGVAIPGGAGKAARSAAGAGAGSELVGAGERLARQQARSELSGSPQSRGWVTRRMNDVRPLVVGEEVEWLTGAGLDVARPKVWATDPVAVIGASCPTPGPLFSPSVVVRHPIPALAR